ncbi:MAG: hypothetical protein BAJALOKI3v1_30045 [Promethearchaeota archaeon]|nr:MAG: hypothetical protein BAJALOKI3v1_30045 [Candidatus Lokiarchaeota archaeon]
MRYRSFIILHLGSYKYLSIIVNKLYWIYQMNLDIFPEMIHTHKLNYWI